MTKLLLDDDFEVKNTFQQKREEWLQVSDIGSQIKYGTSYV